MKLINTDSIQEELLNILRAVGAIITDSHIVGTSGKHMSVYINKDALYPNTSYSSKVGKMFALKNKNLEVDVVAAPALGGIVLSQWTSYYLSKFKKRNILGVYTEKDESKNQIFKRGYDRLVENKKVLVIEDLTTTGESVLKVVNSVRKAGGSVIGVSVMVNRNPQNVTSKMYKAPFSALAILKAEAFDENVCILCKNNIPINTTVGHGKEFLKVKSK